MIFSVPSNFLSCTYKLNYNHPGNREGGIEDEKRNDFYQSILTIPGKQEFNKELRKYSTRFIGVAVKFLNFSNYP